MVMVLVRSGDGDVVVSCLYNSKRCCGDVDTCFDMLILRVMTRVHSVVHE